MGIGDWGLGFGVLGVGGQTPNPTTKPPKTKPQKKKKKFFFFFLNKKIKFCIYL